MDRDHSRGGTFMNAPTARPAQQHDSWPQLFRRKRYDRTPTLSDVEQATLEQVFRQQLHIRGRTRSALLRLYQPLADVCSCLHTPQPVASRVVRTLFLEMHRRQATFWSWSAETWRECLCQTAHAFAQRYGLPLQRREPARLLLAAVAYLLSPHVTLEALLSIDPHPLSTAIFCNVVVS